ncbi:hypothetical protein RHMOL_Rhmol08G0263300 [Rhododendron molle]|uniref:Uncharacterized protein n=1 Tax=Rhododendron molle TaxID=49168 RepID=A0ACC0MSY8_RHOML|nr:hypothetical protein RHMOL_Rhmol08G0263300 [Rhododendron molle]
MDSLQDPFFSNLIHDGSNLGNQFMESQYVSQVGQVAQKESQISVETEPVAKKRGGNFSIEEDSMLVSAWLNISLDAVQGNGQKHKTFWTRVWEFFHENKTFTSERNDNSLMNRWSTIQLSINKFCGYLAQIEAAHQSGMTEQDKVLNELKEDKKAANEKKLELLQISYGLQAEKLKMEQLKEEARIMMLDTSGMPPMQQEYIHQRQMEIVESRKNKS